MLVLLHHHGYLNVGWMGVDLFFVLSGYLITTILRRTRQHQFFWREFWIKRFTAHLASLHSSLARRHSHFLSFPHVAMASSGLFSLAW